MATSERELRERLHGRIGDEILRDTIRVIAKATRSAHLFCRENYSQAEYHDVVAHVRRANIERDWRARLNTFPGVSAAARPNNRRTAYHTLARIAGSAGAASLTVSHVNCPNQLVRDARFRASYAEGANLELFVKPDPTPKDGEPYGIILYTTDDRRGVPAAIHLAVPNGECTAYVLTIDLLARFPDLAVEIFGHGTATNDEQDLVPQLRPIRKTDDEE
ncbi:MAG: hypothetical protein ABR538_02085 [Candidatus Binatia bacterium]